MAVNLHAAHKKTDSCAAHEAVLVCFLLHELFLACSAQKIAHVQYTKVDLHAAHFMSHVCFDSSQTKIEEYTHVHCTQVSS